MKRARGALDRLARDARGQLGLTVAQGFLGAVSLGIAMFRGTEVNASFHHQNLLGHANYGASKLASDHARSANVVVNNNVVETSIMGPRFGVESDNIAMDANAEIACPTCPHGSICNVCRQYQQNKPRAMAKLMWVRAKQQLLWGTLGKLSGQLDQLSSMQAGSLVQGDIAKADPQVQMRVEDPSRSGDIWGGSATGTACKLASKDILPTPVTGHAFPALISPNLLEGLPKSLVQMMPQMICQITSAAQNAGGNSDSPQLPQIPSVAKATNDECRDLQRQMQCTVAAAQGQPGNCGLDVTPTIADMSVPASGVPQFSSDVQPYVHCQAASAASPVDMSGGGYYYKGKHGKLVTCTFDEDKCEDDKLSKNSDDYLRSKLDLPKVMSTAQSLVQSLGGDQPRKPSSGGSNPQNFCACTYTQKPVDETMVQISDAVRKISSFGMAQPSEALRKQREYRSCGRWYFPDRKGEFASTPEDEQPFVGAWKWTQTNACPGGGS